VIDSKSRSGLSTTNTSPAERKKKLLPIDVHDKVVKTYITD
jgi:hypothetical protein